MAVGSQPARNLSDECGGDSVLEAKKLFALAVVETV